MLVLGSLILLPRLDEKGKGAIEHGYFFQLAASEALAKARKTRTADRIYSHKRRHFIIAASSLCKLSLRVRNCSARR